jgi:hypothetical protein
LCSAIGDALTLAGREVYRRSEGESRNAGFALHDETIARDTGGLSYGLDRISLKRAPQRIDIALEIIE